MAYIRARRNASGQETFRVIWRSNGNGQQEGEDFDDKPSATKFRDLVNGHGQQWPPGWVRGVGFATPEQENIPEEEMFGPFAHRYIDLLTDVSEQTRGNYRKFVNNHMLPWFQELTVRGDRETTLGRDHISRWINDLAAGRRGPHHAPGVKRRKYAPKTIRNYHGLLFGVLQAAADAEPPLRTSNPCAHTQLPGNNHIADEATFLEREEYAILRAHLASDVVDLVDALVSTGLRWGEMTGLQVRDLTLHGDRPKLRVQRAWKRGEHGKYLGPPKTVKSRRTIVLSPSQVALFSRNCRGKRPTDFVFTAPEGNAWDSGGFYSARWKPAISSAMLVDCLTKKPRLHDLRHTHASWLIAKKVPLPAIQARLGHESITTTVDRYGHLLAMMDEEVIAAVEWSMAGMDLAA
ncbi:MULTISPECIES: tyrosine-type recombinase/integrase [Streptomyces]|uniref:Tyrosine-type recombinase/integrase n=1 Tax=Streptomyces ramulosus TaxID=47762 RepID=A0ABW1FQQ8_9ACTN